MCGIFLETKSILEEPDLHKICSEISHRGPDNQTIYLDSEMRISIAFARLAIQDVSSQSNQPFFSENRMSYIVFNGEIYNKDHLRNQLPTSLKIRTNSDTEILLQSINFFGIEKTLNQIQGMFALIYVNRESRIIQVARDMFGIKPMYYSVDSKGSYKFASEIKVLRKLVSPQIDTEMVREFVMCGLLDHTSNTFYNQIKKITPGTVLTIEDNGAKLTTWVDNTVNDFDFESLEEAISTADSIIMNSIHDSLISDVPVGLTLSSGVDSNLIRTMVELEKPNILLHVIGWDESDYSEVKEASKYLDNQSNLHINTFSSNQVFDLIHNSFTIHDEPYTSPFVAIWPEVFKRMKKQGIGVVLDGTGADEIFFGYTKYQTESFSSYSLRALDGLEIGLRFRSNFIGEPRNVLEANEQDIFSLKLPRSLRFLDSSSMSASIEVRPVFLTKSLFHLSRSFPMDWIMHQNNTKYPLRRILANHLPSFPAFASKKNIQYPQNKWMLQNWRQNIINEINNIDVLLDNLSNKEEKNSINVVKNSYLESNSHLSSLSPIWRIFNANLWLNTL